MENKITSFSGHKLQVMPKVKCNPVFSAIKPATYSTNAQFKFKTQKTPPPLSKHPHPLEKQWQTFALPAWLPSCKSRFCTRLQSYSTILILPAFQSYLQSMAHLHTLIHILTADQTIQGTNLLIGNSYECFAQRRINTQPRGQTGNPPIPRRPIHCLRDLVIMLL